MPLSSPFLQDGRKRPLSYGAIPWSKRERSPAKDSPVRSLLADLEEENNDTTTTTTAAAASHTTLPQQHLLVIHPSLIIIAVELLERLAYYGLLAVVVPFTMTRLGMTEPQADTVSLAFVGTCYFMPLGGGWLADARLGRYRTLVAAQTVYVAGLALLTATAFLAYKGNDCDVEGDGGSHACGARRAMFFVSLALVAVGTGGIKPNCSAFGADQYVGVFDQQNLQKFFAWYYWGINLGAILGFSVIAYIEQEIKFGTGFTIIVGLMVLSLLMLRCTSARYTKAAPTGSVVGNTARILCSAARTGGWKRACKPGSNWLDRAKISRGGAFLAGEVEDVRTLGRVLPVLGTFVLYWTLYSQMTSVFVNQATGMDLRIGGAARGKGFTAPVAAITVFDSIVILLTVPLMDGVVYPLFERRGWVRLTQLRRIGIGFVLAICALVVAALVEQRRLALLRDGKVVENVISGKHYKAADMSVFYLVPQYALMGLSEVFASITGLEFVYDYSPRSMRSVAMALYLVMQGFGAYIGTALVNVVDECQSPGCVKWIPRSPPLWKTPVGDAHAHHMPPGGPAHSFPASAPTPYPTQNPNLWGHMDWYYFLLAGAMVPNVIVFCAVAMRFTLHGQVPRRYGTANSDGSGGDGGAAPGSPALASATATAVDIMARDAEEHLLHTGERLGGRGADWLIAFEALRLDSRIGHGMSGVVWRGSYCGYPVAIKALKLHTAAYADDARAAAAAAREGGGDAGEAEQVLASPGYYQDMATLEQFGQEAAVLSKLHHPCIIRFYGICADTASSSLFIVTELAERSLSDLLFHDKDHCDSATIFSIAAQIAEGVGFIHHKQLVHRDLKPENVLLDRGLSVKICDFGLARAAMSSSMTGQRGTPAYMAPELMTEAPTGPKLQYDAKVDTYSFGVMLWALHTRQPPHKGLSSFAIIAQVMAHGLRPAIPGTCPEGLARLIRECWDQDPQKRPSMMATLKRIRGMSHKGFSAVD